MIGREFFRKRNDGVNLYRTIDAKVDENGEFILDENGKLIPTGYMIRQIETDTLYSEAIDVESAYTYTETDIPTDVEPTGEATEEDLYNALAELGVSDND